jgi:hypothetical protein
MGPKAFMKSYGPDTILKVRRRDGQVVILDFKRPNIMRQPMKFYGTLSHPDPLLVKIWKISTISALGQSCANCNNSENVEMHHIKHIRTINVKLSKFDQLAARVNRKQIPLCRPCHIKVHQGKHQGMSLKHFQYIRWKGTPKWASFGALIRRDMISSNQNQKKNKVNTRSIRLNDEQSRTNFI